jgi:adenylate cyclase
MGLRVLLIQSDPQSMQVLGKFFRERGDEVWESSELGPVEEILEQRRPNLMLLDIHYPGGDWLLFLKQAHQRYPDLKIILTNKYPDLQREILAAENGVNIFLRQPFTRNWIENALQRAIEPTADNKKADIARQLPRVKMPVRIKITLPYLLLALLFALASAYIVSQVVLESVQDRYLNQLIETGRQTSDWMVREEDRLLGTLRLISNTQGVADAILKQDSEALRSLVLPVAVNAGEEAVEILDTQAVSLFSMHLKAGGSAGSYDFTRGDSSFRDQGFVRQTLLVGPDKLGDKYAGLIKASWGNLFYVSGPIFASDGKLVGLVLVGKSVRTLARQASQDTASETTYYGTDGQPLASTIYTDKEAFPLSIGQVNQILAAQDKSSLSRKLNVSQIDYAEILGPWEARGNVNLGIAGTALSQSFLLRTSSVTQLEIFILVAIAILLVVGVGLFIASRITRPLVRLANASSQVAQGNLEVKVDSQGNDEVAVLAHSFNYMVAGLQEGSVYRDLLGRTVSPEVREQLRQTFETGNLRLAGQQSVATILMTDIRGFTSISERADPATVLTWLNEYFGHLVPIITAHGGVVNKFDGDAMLAFFGILPRRLTPKQSAYSACKAALEILKEVDELNAQRIEREEPALITGIGINTGVVIAGGLGSSDRLHYTIIGDTVNTAQRLESLTRQVYTTSGILVGQSTTLAMGEFGSDFQLYPAGSFAVKGKSDQIKVYRLATVENRVPEVML